MGKGAGSTRALFVKYFKGVVGLGSGGTVTRA
jgi:hypothetical protein